MKFIFISGESMQYKTKQRDAVLRFFMEHAGSCFTVRDVYAAVDAGESTVFRAITSLTEAGLLRKFTAGNGRGECACYQYDGGRPGHIHLKCERCGELIHMDCAFMETILSHFLNEHGFSVDSGRTVIYGLCASCRDKGGEEAADLSDSGENRT